MYLIATLISFGRYNGFEMHIMYHSELNNKFKWIIIRVHVILCTGVISYVIYSTILFWFDCQNFLLQSMHFTNLITCQNNRVEVTISKSLYDICNLKKFMPWNILKNKNKSLLVFLSMSSLMIHLILIDSLSIQYNLDCRNLYFKEPLSFLQKH